MGFLYPAAPPPARWPWSSVGYVLSLATRSSVQHNEGTFSPHAFVFLLQSLQIYQDSVTNPTIQPTFLPKEPHFAVFFYTIAGNPLPRAMPHRSPVPNSSLCTPRSDAAASVRGRNALPDDPTHDKTKNARRCMGIRSALRWQMQCAAWAHAPHCVFGSRTAGLWLQRAEGVSHRHCQCPRKGFPCAIISAGRDGPKPCQGRKIVLRHLVCPICPGKRGMARGWSKLLQWLFCPIGSGK